MADATIAANQVGAYELSIAAGATITVDVAATGVNSGGDVTVLVHSGTTPVYAKNGTTVTAKEPGATMIPASTWSTVVRGGSNTIAITSAAAAVVSVYR